MSKERIAIAKPKVLAIMLAAIAVVSAVVGVELLTLRSAAFESSNPHKLDQTAMYVETPDSRLVNMDIDMELSGIALAPVSSEMDKTPNHPVVDSSFPSEASLMVDYEEDLEVFSDIDGFVYCPTIELSEELQRFTYEQCKEQGLDYTVVLALMWRESRFHVNAVGYNTNGTRDHGLMQINDVNKPWLQNELGIYDLMDPKQNIIAGTTMLGKMASKYGTHNALMAYQYGEMGMIRKLEQGVTTNQQIQQLYVKSNEFQELIVYSANAKAA